MNFDWSHYLDLAQELSSQAGGSSHRDANLRSSISRAYYATYHKARHHLRNKWGILVSEDASAHKQVSQEFLRKNYKQIATTLKRMRIDRNMADYRDVTINLDNTAKENLKRANQVLSALSKL